MTKRVKIKAIIAISCTPVIILSSILMYVYGWRLFDFTFCMNPNDIESVKVEKTEKDFLIEGSVVPWHVTYYNGYVWEEKDNTLYLGIQRSMFLKTSEGARFTISYPNYIDKIVLKNGKHERVIYEDGNEVKE